MLPIEAHVVTIYVGALFSTILPHPPRCKIIGCLVQGMAILDPVVSIECDNLY